MEALLEGLNEAQRHAVTTPADVVQVLAPPGSGKTKTLTARVAYLVNHQNFKPWNIVVCTFTIKAAREMKERIGTLVGDGIEKKLIAGTFHSVARRFLVRYGQEIGIEKNFGIADTSDSTAIIKRILKRGDYSVDPKNARSRISGLKAKGISAEHFVATIKKADEHEFACVYSEYEETLKSSNLLDYDDLLLRCTDLLRKHPICVSGIEAVLIDEYQDTNNVQYELMTLLAQQKKRITIVGDPDQSIYGFRSAEIENLYRMRKDYPGTLPINLENNYRSSGCILYAAMAVIEQDENRPEKPLQATHTIGEQPTLRHLRDATVEAEWIVQEILRSKVLTAGLLDYNDYAILLRSATLSLAIEKELGKAGIPYRMVGGRRFFDRAEIKIVLDYLRVINQPNQNDAIARVINVPPRGVGDKTRDALLEEAERKKMSLWDLVRKYAQGYYKPTTSISAQAGKGIETFVNIILSSRQKLVKDDDECNLFDVISHVLQKLAFQAYLKKKYPEDADWQDRWDNIGKLVEQATQIAATIGQEDSDDALPVVEGIEQRPDTAADILSKFLANVALSTDAEKENGEQASQVTMSTIHAAKGLEWPIVFIPGVYDGSIPHSRSEDHDEERRLLYVGMTRAQGLLYLSCPMKQSGQQETTLSRFVSGSDMEKYFNARGPSIGCSAISDLSLILRRPCPSQIDVDTARKSLEHIEDDQYPAKREDIDTEKPTWGSYDHEIEPQVKRRKLNGFNTASGVTASVSMHQASSFSISKTTVPGGKAGFVTAKDVQSQIVQEAEAVAALISASGLSSGKVAYKATKLETKEATTTRTKGAKPRAAGQGAITSFFSRPAASTASMKAQEPDLPIRKVPSLISSQPTSSGFKAPSLPRSSSTGFATKPLSDISNAQRSSSQAYKAPSFSTHRPRKAPMMNKPKRADLDDDEQSGRYVLLSSSPVKSVKEIPSSPPRYAGDGPVEDVSSPLKLSSTSTFPTSSGFRPASTFHTTSVGQLQSNGGVSGQPRKTLGMGRSVQGWSVKHKGTPRPR